MTAFFILKSLISKNYMLALLIIHKVLPVYALFNLSVKVVLKDEHNGFVTKNNTYIEILAKI